MAGQRNFEVGHEVEGRPDEVEAAVRPIGPRKPTLTEKLENFEPAKHGGEAMSTGRIGVEVF
jgi:antitoxin MazE